MYIIEPDSTDQTIYIRLRNSTTGLAQTGLAWNSAGASAYYTRTRGSATAITLATLASPTAAHSDGGFVEVDATNAKGLYRLDLPDAAVASGVDYVLVSIEFDGVIEESLLVQLSPAVDISTTGVSDVADQVWEENLAAHSGTAGSTAEQLASISAAGVADAVWDESAAAHVAAGSFGELVGQIADNIWDEVIESGAPANAQTARQMLRLFAAALLGKTDNTGHDWGARDLSDSKYRIEASLDTSGLRTQISTLDGS